MSLSQTKYYTYTVHSFRLGDVEDPDIYAAIPIGEWQDTPAGKWVMEHALEPPTYSIMQDYHSYGVKCRIDAKFDERNAFEYCLRFAK